MRRVWTCALGDVERDERRGDFARSAAVLLLEGTDGIMGEESAIQARGFALLKKMGYVFARNNSGARRGGKVKFGLRLGNRFGDSDSCGGPDSLIFLPGSRVLGIEWKAPGESLSAAQRDWVRAVRHLKVVEVDSVRGMLEAIGEMEEEWPK
jgi:hypothetical protein